MQVIITKDQLTGGGPCTPVFLDSPEWDEKKEALVYEDWDETVERLSSSMDGLGQLGWLVSRSLVPMNRMQFRKLRRAKKKMRAEAARADVKERKADTKAKAKADAKKAKADAKAEADAKKAEGTETAGES